jgi:hypothetical protein
VGPGLIPKPVASVIAVAITSVWIASQVAPFFLPAYKASESINTALMLILGAVFAMRRSDNSHAERPADEPPRPAAAPSPRPRDPPPAVDERRESAADLIDRLRREHGGGPRA